MAENASGSQVNLSLKSLLVPSKTVEVEFPGFSGFKVKLSFLSRETLVSIRKKATKTTFKNRQPAEELNDDLFLQLYVQASIKGWSGFKLSYLEQLAPVDLEGQDLENELGYSEDNALFLMKNSSNFDAWVSEQVTELGNFQSSSTKK
jgi:hypothetical protein